MLRAGFVGSHSIALLFAVPVIPLASATPVGFAFYSSCPGLARVWAMRYLVELGHCPIHCPNASRSHPTIGRESGNRTAVRVQSEEVDLKNIANNQYVEASVCLWHALC